MKQACMHIGGLGFALNSKGNGEHNDNIKNRERRLKLVNRENKPQALKKKEKKQKNTSSITQHSNCFLIIQDFFLSYFNNSLYACYQWN